MMHRESGSYFHFLLGGWLCIRVYSIPSTYSSLSPMRYFT